MTTGGIIAICWLMYVFGGLFTLAITDGDFRYAILWPFLFVALVLRLFFYTMPKLFIKILLGK